MTVIGEANIIDHILTRPHIKVWLLDGKQT